MGVKDRGMEGAARGGSGVGGRLLMSYCGVGECCILL